MLHETSVGGRHVSGGIWAQQRYSLGCCFGRGGLLELLIVDGGGAGEAAGAAGESEMRRF